MINIKRLLLISTVALIYSTVSLARDAATMTMQSQPGMTQSPAKQNPADPFIPGQSILSAPVNPYGPNTSDLPVGNAGPSLSAEDARAASEMKNMMQEVDNFRKTLSPDELEKFDRETQEVAARIETRMDEMLKNDPALEERIKNQDPEALDMFFQNVFGPELERAAQEDQAMPTGPSIPEPVEPGPSLLPEEKPEKKPAKEEAKKVDIKVALELIESIIEYSESFKDKMNSIISFQGLYEKWAKDGRLKDWTKDLTWEKFKEKLDLLTESFYELKLKDPDTKEYRHLANLLEDEALWQQLNQYNDDLADNEPRISVPGKGIGELNSASKDAARETINTSLRGITKIQEKLTALIEKYGVTAKKISEEKEKERKKAEELAKQHRPGYIYPIGVGEQEGYIPYYPDQPVGPYTPWSAPSAPSQKPTTQLETKEQKQPESPKAPKGGTAKKEREKGEAEKELDQALEKYTEALSDIQFSIMDNKNLQNFGEYMTSAKEKEPDMAAVEAIKSIQQKLQEAAKLVRRKGTVRLPHVDANTKNMYIQKFAEALNKAEDSAPLRTLISDIDSIDKSRSRVNNRKQFAFFDDQTRRALLDAEARQQEQQRQQAAPRARPAAPQQPSAQAPAQAPQPEAPMPLSEYRELEGKGTSIFTLRDNFKNLNQIIEDLKKVKQKAVPSKQASVGHTQQRERMTEVAD